MDENPFWASFHDALRTYSAALSTYGATPLDKIVLTALSNDKVQQQFITHLQEQQLFINAQFQRIPGAKNLARVIFNFILPPPRVTFLPVQFAVVINDNSGVMTEITDPYFVNLKNQADSLEHASGAISYLRT